MIRTENQEPKPAVFSSKAGLVGAFLLLLAAVTVAYEPAITGGQVWDDNAYITRLDLQPLSGLWRIWFKVGSTEQYYPVLHSAFWIEHCLWGDSTIGYHLANLLLHATAAFLFALVLRRLFDETRSSWAPWLAGLLFALHPVCVESVAWISEQKNTLATVFYLSAALIYLRGRASDGAVPRAVRDPTPYWMATALFVLAVLSKSAVATLPAALLVAAWWKRGRLAWREDVVPLLPWFAISAVSGLFTGWVERKFIGAEGAAFALGPGGRFLVAGRAIWFYLGKLLWPSDLTFIYPRWTVDTHAWWQWLFPLAAAGFTAGLWRLSARNRAPLAAWLFFVGSLFPTLGFLNVYAFLFSYVADHWQYLAALGVIAFAAGACSRSRAAMIAAAAVACVLGVLTWRQCRIYRDGAALYEATLERNPDCWMACNNLAVDLFGEGHTAESIGYFERALRLKPDYGEAWNNFGVALKALGRLKESAAACRNAIRLKPDYAAAYNNLGNALLDQGLEREALEDYETAARLKPGYGDAEQNLGGLLYSEGRIKEAIPHLLEVARLSPGNVRTGNQVANALFQAGRLSEAGVWYAKVLQLDPNDADAQNNLGLVLASAGRLDEAMDRYREAIRLTPGVAAAYFNLANALRELGRYQDAVGYYEDAIRLHPDYPDAENSLGVTFAQTGRLAESVPHFEAALRLRPGMPEAVRNLRTIRDKLASSHGSTP